MSKTMNLLSFRGAILFIFIVQTLVICQPIWGANPSTPLERAPESQRKPNTVLSEPYRSALENAVNTGFYHFEITKIGEDHNRVIVLFGEENHHTATKEQLSAAKKVVDLFQYRAAEFAQDEMSAGDAEYLAGLFRGLGRFADLFIDYSKPYFNAWGETSIISYALSRGTTLTSVNEILYNGLYIGDLKSDLTIDFFSPRISFLEAQLNADGLSDLVSGNISLVAPIRIQSTNGRLVDFGRVSPTNSNRLFFKQQLPYITIAVEYGDMYKWENWPHNPFRKFSEPNGVSLRDYRMAENIVLLSSLMNFSEEPLLFVAATAHVKYIKTLLSNQEFVDAVLSGVN